MSVRYGLEVGERAPGEVLLSVRGEVDLDVAPQLLDSILCAGLAHEPGHRMVVDLSEVSFIDSSGLAALLEADRWLTNQEQALVIARAPARVVRLFELTGLDHVLHLEPGTAGAAAAERPT
jgi:anti-sigma B factor antagonist